MVLLCALTLVWAGQATRSDPRRQEGWRAPSRLSPLGTQFGAIGPQGRSPATQKLPTAGAPGATERQALPGAAQPDSRGPPMSHRAQLSQPHRARRRPQSRRWDTRLCAATSLAQVTVTNTWTRRPVRDTHLLLTALGAGSPGSGASTVQGRGWGVQGQGQHSAGGRPGSARSGPARCRGEGGRGVQGQGQHSTGGRSGSPGSGPVRCRGGVLPWWGQQGRPHTAASSEDATTAPGCTHTSVTPWAGLPGSPGLGGRLCGGRQVSPGEDVWVPRAGLCRTWPPAAQGTVTRGPGLRGPHRGPRRHRKQRPAVAQRRQVGLSPHGTASHRSQSSKDC